jgi:protein phosphatase 1D
LIYDLSTLRINYRATFKASQFAKENLYWKIVESQDFWSDDDTKILNAIREGFVKCHMEMWDELNNWPKTASGLPSTSGSTATVLFIKKSKAYVGHVGDSGLVIGYNKNGSSMYNQSLLNAPWLAKKLTKVNMFKTNHHKI